ncbi:MAG: Histidine--tRNA ligase [Patescibacteria group bacterium]|nr:Histidine--tRNA ligase [Patescibacteria group bacterium]
MPTPNTTKSDKAKNNNQSNITKLKGTQDIRNDQYYQFQGMFEKAQEISEYYGFKPIETPTIERASTYQKAIGENTDIVEKEMYKFSVKGSDSIALRPEYTAGIVRAYIEDGMVSEPQPIMLYSYGPTFRHEKPQLGRYREFRQFNLEILGSDKAVADALVIKTVYDILTDFGFKELIIDINSMGDTENRQPYIKDLSSYYKKLSPSLCKNCQERIKTNPLRLLDCKEPECQEFKAKAPQIINYLSPDARKHFKDVLKFLEEMEIPFRINNTLVRGQDYYKRTVFEVIQVHLDEENNEKELTICGGGRYDLSKHMGQKKEIPSVGAAMSFERIVMMPDCQKMNPRIIKNPKFYFIQLGFEAKLKSLHIIDILRHAKIPVHQNLSKDSLGAQLALASELNIPYALIFGQKEAMEGNVILRDMKKHEQEIIKIENLCEYIKKIK